VLADLDLTVEAGERVLLAGPSGSGKSTLLRALAGLLLSADTGDLSGEVLVDGAPPEVRPGHVGLLLQDPSAAVVAERVGRDVAFGPENLRLPREEIWRRVHEALETVRFPYDTGHPTAALSGGESQRLALAGALALRPGVVLLDEPTSMLDDASASQVRRGVLDAVAQRGSTMVVVEHRLEPWLPHVDRIVVLDADGSVAADGAPSDVLAAHGERLAEAGVWVPGWPEPDPVDVPAALVEPWDGPAVRDHAPGGAAVEAVEASVWHARRLGARASRRGTRALQAVSARLAPGEALAVTGASGAGKSTLVALLAGLRPPDAGAVRSALPVPHGLGDAPAGWPSAELARWAAWVPQTPEHGMVRSTVAEEVRAAAVAVGRDAGRAERRATALLEALGLDAVAGRNPHRLSGGEQRRLMLAAALVPGPRVLLLDEPTVGQDRRTWATVLGCCLSARSSGVAVGAATHDRTLVRRLADRRLHLAQGRESDAEVAS
jgi:energy-coupling factor transporter ATP-binding protein EcfA2